MYAIQKNMDKVMSNPTALSYGLIGLTTLILGYYTFNDGSVADADATRSEGATPSENSTPSMGGLFGSEEKKDEGAEKTEEESVGGLFGAEEKKEEAQAENKEEKTGEGLFENLPFSGSEETAEKKVGGKNKKTRREKRKNKKTAKRGT